MDIKFDALTGKELELKSLNRINIILGRNGSGKSRLLRALDENMTMNSEYRVSYVTPERSGSFQRDGNIETNIANNPSWSTHVRRANQVNGSSFKAMSHLALRNAETAYLRQLQNIDARGRSFQTDCLYPISRLLSNVSIQQGSPDFEFRSAAGDVVQPDKLSSGESETVALASEVLSFLMAAEPGKLNVLLLDEPDVHQHPDLQARFGQYLLDRLAEVPDAIRDRIAICIATHSTALVCALAASSLVVVGNKDFDSNTITFSPIPQEIKKVAPFFGHPLSLSLSNDPMLILEGEDDERVWQQLARTSQGRVRLFPVLAQSVDQQSSLESFCEKMLTSIYDAPKAFSIRDGDGKSGPIDDAGCVRRFRLQCYAIENALVTTECLARLGTSWPEFQALARTWLNDNKDHKAAALLQQLIESTDRLRNIKIKTLRQLIVAISGVTKPWEIVVGQALAGLIDGTTPTHDPYSLHAFIGEAATELLHAKFGPADESIAIASTVEQRC